MPPADTPPRFTFIIYSYYLRLFTFIIFIRPNSRDVVT